MAEVHLQPQPELDDDGQTRVRCDRPGVAAVSNVIGDPAAVVQWIALLCDTAGLEYDDSVDGEVTISIPPGS